MGNKLVWIIGGVLVLLVAAAVVLKFVFPSTSDPTRATLQEGVLDKAELTIDPSEIIGRPISGTGNAGDDYDKAIKLFMANEELLQHAMNAAEDTGKLDLNSDVLTLLKNIAGQVALGTEKKEMHYTFVYTPEEFKVDWCYSPVNQLEKPMQALNLLMAYYEDEKQKKYAEAAKIAESILVMGWHMVNERSRPYMLQIGVNWQRTAIERLRYFYEKMGDQYASRMPAIKKYEKQLGTMALAFDEKYRTVFADIEDLHPGDIFNIAENDKDRAWQVQAILWLGVLKYTHGQNRGDMRYIDKLIQKYLGSSDPLKTAAAKAAKGMTRDDYNKL